MKICKLLLATVGASVLLGALVSGASARNWSVSNQNLSAMWRSLEFALPGATTRCQLTVEGSLHTRTLPKIVGSLIGYITKVILGPCTAGTASVLAETLPWHVRYSAFSGSLPEITSIIIHVVNASFRMREAGGISCLVRTSAAEPSVGTFHRNTANAAITEVGVSGEIRTGAECFGVRGRFTSDSGAVSLLGTSNVLISLSLI